MKSFKVTLVILTSSLLAGATAVASLGGAEASVEQDRQTFKAPAATMQDNGTYRVHEITTGGTSIKEYVSPQGVVFGVSWKGRVNPDFQTLLGTYFNESQTAPHKKGRGPTVFDGPNLHLEKGGHMRALGGRAYVSGLIPSGLTESVVQ